MLDEVNILKTLRKLLWLAGLCLFLVACQQSPADLSENIKAESQNMIATLNTLQAADQKLQAAFDADVKEDESLKILSSRKSQMKANHEERAKEFQRFEKAYEAWQKNIDQLAAQKNKSKEAAYAYADVEPAAEASKKAMQAFRTAYQKALDEEENNMQAWQKEDADYQTFGGGIDQIEDAYQQGQKALADGQEGLEALAGLKIETGGDHESK